MQITTAEKTIEKLRTAFTAYGLPEMLVADNGPRFRSEEFRRKPRTRWLLMKPNLPEYQDNGSKRRRIQDAKFRVQDPVLVKIVRGWLPRCIVEVVSPVTYRVNVGDVIRLDHLQKCHLQEEVPFWEQKNSPEISSKQQAGRSVVSSSETGASSAPEQPGRVHSQQAGFWEQKNSPGISSKQQAGRSVVSSSETGASSTPEQPGRVHSQQAGFWEQKNSPGISSKQQAGRSVVSSSETGASSAPEQPVTTMLVQDSKGRVHSQQAGFWEQKNSPGISSKQQAGRSVVSSSETGASSTPEQPVTTMLVQDSKGRVHSQQAGFA
ncbi:hypothetical protein PR048_018771 [Dryococelus australis]|uniref:Integrase catalytic domain-containing protein n=1 Tax=Dryococelus australis TaxID=614101 RepID=A0ABQ9HD96_9NEOP|nr:hypothetical protein PR048_018771 [Dryococelus australis]